MVLKINTKARERYEANFRRLESISAQLEALGHKLVGTDFKMDLKDILDRGHKAYREQFFEQFGHLYPSVINQESQFNAVTNVRAGDVKAITDEFNAVLEKFVTTRTPSIGKTLKHTSNVYETFEQKLHFDKIEQYNICKKVAKAANDFLKAFPQAQYTIFNVRRLDTTIFKHTVGVGIELNLEYFTTA